MLHSGTIKVSYDRFRDVVTASLEPLQLKLADFRLAVAIFGSGQSLATAPAPSILITGFLMQRNDTWQYLRCHDVAFIADDVRIIDLPTKHNGDVGKGVVVEQIQFVLTRDQLIRLATAKSVEAKVCNREFHLQGTEIMALQDLASRLKD
jgi:hypothetical protein